MNFLEQWFGWAPDGGSGAAEFLIVSAMVLAFPVLNIIFTLRAPAEWLRRYELSDRD